MDVSGIAATATSMSQARLQQTQELSVLKKAIDIQAEGALQLLASVAPSAPASVDPGQTLGASIDVRA